jgi:hypothetical protein
LQVTGLPAAAAAVLQQFTGALDFSGIPAIAGYTQAQMAVPNSASVLQIILNGFGATRAFLQAVSLTSGTALTLRSTIAYQA